MSTGLGDAVAKNDGVGDSAAGVVPADSVPGGPLRRTLDAGAGVVSRYGVVIVFALLTLSFCLALPRTFATSGNFHAMASSQAVLLVLALAELIPLRSGDFDLSVASTMIMSASIVGVLNAHHHADVITVLIVALLIGGAAGAINGVLIVLFGLDAFVTTLGSMTVYGGIAYAVTNTQVVFGLSNQLIDVTTHNLFGLPLACYYGWAIALIVWYIFEMTPLGRHLGVVGENRDAARLNGLSLTRLRFGAFTSAGLIAGFGGFVLAGTLGAVDPTVGPQFLLQPFAAAFLGATTVKVGQFNVVGCLVALYLLVVGVTGIQLFGGADWVSNVFNGGALVGAVLFARLARRRDST